MKLCIYCENICETIVHKHYCSDECYEDDNEFRELKQEKVQKESEKVCVGCQKTFIPKHRAQKYCKPSCCQLANKKRTASKYIRKPLPDSKICKNCKKDFKPDSVLQIFCKPDCRNKYRYNDLVPIVCKGCPKVFTPTHGLQQYHNVDCKYKARLRAIRNASVPVAKQIPPKELVTPFKPPQNDYVPPAIQIEPKEFFIDVIDERVCKGCEKIFTPSHRSQEYHNPDCRIKSSIRARKELKRLTIEKRICKGCKKEFQPTHRKMVYCKPLCRPAKFDPNRGKPIDKICIVCQNGFSTFTKMKKICSDECINHRVKHHLSPIEKTCKKCGTIHLSTLRKKEPYCADCKDDVKLKKRRLPVIITTKPCIICEKDFKASKKRKICDGCYKHRFKSTCKSCQKTFRAVNSNVPFCCDECKESYPSVMMDVPCKFCEKTFKSLDKRKKFCNDDCRNDYNKAYNKKKYREKIDKFNEGQ